MGEHTNKQKDKTRVRPPFAAFRESEHRARLARARKALSNGGFAGAVSIAPENLFYIAGYDSLTYFSQQALVFNTKDGRDPTLIVRDVDLPLAKETTWVSDIRTYHLHASDVTELIEKVAREHEICNGIIGIELESFAVTSAYASALQQRLEPTELADATTLLNELQYIKSESEMAYIREAANYANIGIETARRAIRPGISEIALCAEVEFAIRQAGSDYPAMPTECASGPRSAGCHAAPMPRILEKGDLVHLEFAGAARRYHCVSMITAALGEPGARARTLYDAGLESYRAGLALCKPGAPVAEIEDASLEPLRSRNLEHAAMMRFGLGIGIGYPPAWVGTFQMDRYSDAKLERGMLIYVHSCLELLDEGLGIIQGGSYYIGNNDIEALSGAADCELLVV